MADSFIFKKVKYNVLSGTNVCVAKSESHKKLDGDLVIPETIEKNGTTYHVVEMEDWCFAHSAIRSVSLPKGLKVIPYFAFFFIVKNWSRRIFPTRSILLDSLLLRAAPFFRTLLFRIPSRLSKTMRSVIQDSSMTKWPREAMFCFPGLCWLSIRKRRDILMCPKVQGSHVGTHLTVAPVSQPSPCRREFR